MNVDLPAPLGPRSATMRPGSISRSTPSTATTPGNRFVRPRVERTGARAADVASSTASAPRSGVSVSARPGGSGRARPGVRLSAIGLLVGHVGVDVVERMPPGARPAGELGHVALGHQVDGGLDEGDLARAVV